MLAEAVAGELGFASLFGPMPATMALGDLPPDPSTAEHLRRTLFERESVRVLVEGARSAVRGQTRGVLVGGTLSVLTMSIGD